MSRSISPTYLLASQYAPPYHHLSDNSFAFLDAPAPLVLPVDPVDITDTNTMKVTRLWPSCVPLFTFTGHPQLQERKELIIKILKLRGRIGYNLRTASARVLTNNQYTNTFSEETRLLDRLLTSVISCTTFTKDIVYKLDGDIYQELCAKLTARRKLASSSLHDFGYSDLEPPVWVISTAQGLTSNDFEMYAFHYRIHVEHFLHMLDYVHDWDRLQTRVYLDERLLAAQRNADRARLGKMEYCRPDVPPSPYSDPLKSKTSCQTSVSDWSCGGVHHVATVDTGQQPNNSWDAGIQGRPYCQVSRISPTPYSDKSGLKMTNTSTQDNSPESSVTCDKISTPRGALNHNVSSPILHPSTDGELRTFRIASNTPCRPFSEQNKNSRLPRKVRRHINQVQRRLQRVLHITGSTMSHRGDYQCIPVGMKERVQLLLGFTILGCEATCISVTTPDPNVLQMIVDAGSCFTRNSQMVCRVFSAWPKVRLKQTMNVMEQIGRIKCWLHSQCLPGPRIEIERATAPTTINWECHDLFFKQYVGGENYQQQGYSSPYHFFSSPARCVSNITSSLTAVGSRNTISPVRLPGKWSHSRRSQRMRRSRTTRKSQRIRTVHNPHRLTIRINMQTSLDAASEQLGSIASGHEFIITFSRCIPSIAFTLANRELGELMVHRALCQVQNSRFPEIRMALLDVINGIRYRQQPLQRTQGSPHLEILCQLTPKIGNSLATVGNWNVTSPVRIPRKGFCGICPASRGIKRRSCSTRKSQHIRMVHDPHLLTIMINMQMLPNTTFEELSTTAGCEDSDIMTLSHQIPSFTFTLADRELGEFLADQASCRFQSTRSQAKSSVLRDLTASFRVKQQDLQGIRRSPRLKFRTEVVVVKEESRLLLTDHPPSVAFNTISPKGNLPVKSEHDQSNLWLIDISNDVHRHIFTAPIAIYRITASRNTEINLVAWSINVALALPPSKVDEKFGGHKRDSVDMLGKELKDKTLIQSQMPDANSSLDGPMVDESNKWRNSVAHHQYHSCFGKYSQDPVVADPLHRMQLSSIYVSPEDQLNTSLI